jgi:hypothetical protein
MKKRLIVPFLLLCSCLLMVSTAYGQKYKVEKVNASTSSEGDRIRGPRSIKPVYVNRIRYRVAVKSKITFSPGPSLALPFIPQLPQAGGSANSGGDTAANANIREDFMVTIRNIDRARDNPEEQFRNIRMGLDLLTRRKAMQIQNPISSLLADTKDARDATESFVRESDSVLLGGPQNVLHRLTPLIRKIENADRTWPDHDINEFQADVDALENRLLDITDNAWLAANKERVDAVRSSLRLLREGVAVLGHNNQANGVAAQYDDAIKVLRQWRDIFADANAQGESFFELPYVDAGCGGAFDQNKETAVTLIKQDRLAANDTQPAEQELATVFCSSPFSISGGFGFSTVNEREFVFVPSIKSVTENGVTTQKVINRFGFKNNSSFRPIPLLLLNTRIYEPNDTIAVHLSAGAGVDIKTGQAGTDVEFVVGPSISFKRSMFLTVGAHIGRVPKLAGGFTLDQEVPEGVSEPPVEKAWKTGVIFAFTYKLK